jgi:hypothetical protein
MNYYELHGDLEVPCNYVVPLFGDDWAEELWGMKLGAIVTDIVTNDAYEEHRADFEDLGMDFKLLRTRHGRRKRGVCSDRLVWSDIKLALDIYRNVTGHLRVGGAFSIPEHDASWPQRLWGMRLGAIARNIRTKEYLVEHRDELLMLGFPFDEQPYQVPWKLVQQALDTYKALYGDLLVPYRFTVPVDKHQIWPDEKLWGLRLGSIVQRIRNRNAYSEHHSDLRDMGFVFVPQKKRYGFDNVVSALLTYKSIYGDMLVPSSFIVPENDDDDRWSPSQRGMRLGKIVGNIRNGGAYEEQKSYLASIGFDFGSQFTSWEELSAALSAYRQLYGDLEIPRDFRVPINDSSWAQGLWGMNLGCTVSNIRHLKTWKRYHKELKALGVSFEKRQRRYEWKVVRKAILRYKKLYDCIRVPRSYVIPHNDGNWSSDLWGIKLGQVVYNIRHLNSFSEHWEQLRSLGFTQSTSAVVYTWEQVLGALRLYAEKKGDLRIPQKFVVPRNSSCWSDDLGGMRLGEIVYRIRNKGLYVEHREELEAIGFDYSTQRVVYGWERVKAALLTYKNVYGNLSVSRSFKITRPSASAYITVPLATTNGTNVGAAVNSVQFTAYVDNYGRLSDKPSYPLVSVGNTVGMGGVQGADGYVAVREFGKPAFTNSDLIWPAELWGIRLGEVTHNIRTHGAYARRHRKELVELGFDLPFN